MTSLTALGSAKFAHRSDTAAVHAYSGPRKGLKGSSAANAQLRRPKTALKSARRTRSASSARPSHATSQRERLALIPRSRLWISK